MTIIDVGSGPPLVLIPGIQGRWEWMKPAVDALATRCRVITFSLADEPTSHARFDPSLGFDNYVRQVADVMDTKRLTAAAVCGVSFGGLIAGAFAAQHPDRVSALILSSAPPPTWQPDARVRRYLRAPRLMTPLFCLASLRMYHEIAVATGGGARALRAAGAHLFNVVTHLSSPVRMAKRVDYWMGWRAAHGGRSDPRGPQHADSACWGGTQDPPYMHTAPTLVLTGEPDLDRVVPVSATREYVTLCRGASVAVVPRTGHIGLVTRPVEYAAIVGSFVEHHAGEAAPAGSERRLVG